MIDHRRVNHPSTKKCTKFPNCERGESCLYIHEGTMESVQTQASQALEGTKFTCRSCDTDFEDKYYMMIHRKNEHTSEVNMAETLNQEMIDDFLTNTAWDVHSTYCTVLKSMPATAIFGRDMMFNLPYC